MPDKANPERTPETTARIDREVPEQTSFPANDAGKVLPRKEEQRGTRNVFMWGVAIAIVLFIVLLLAFFLGPSAIGS